MVDIKVGEYVRTKDGVIDIVDALYGMIENTVHLKNQKWFDTRNIVKHSKNLIDLIEDGDIIELDDFHRDRYQVMEIHGVLSIYVIESDNYEGIGNFEIRRILTKEQYTANCYKVGGEDEKI